MYNIYLKNISEMVEKRKETGPILETNYLSSIIKSRRMELKLTLAQTTEHICSEALLSKLERNLMSSKNEKVALLCERLNLDYDNLINLETNDRIEKLLYYYFEDQFNEILQIEDKICEDVFIAQDEIIKAYKYFINREFKKLHLCVIGLDNVKECLSDIELFALLLIVLEYNLYSLQLKKAENYLKLLFQLEIRNEKYSLFLKEKKFILHCISETREVEYLYCDINKNYNKFSMEKQFKFNLYYNQTMSSNHSYNYLVNMGKHYVPEQYLDEYKYAKAFVLTKMNNYIDAMKFIIESNVNHIKFASLYAYNLFMYQNTNPNEVDFKNYKYKLVSLIKICDQTPGEALHISFLKLMQLEIDKSNSDIICNFIKNQLLKELYGFSYPLYDEYIKDRYCLLLGKLCKYKEAYLYLLETKMDLKK